MVKEESIRVGSQWYNRLAEEISRCQLELEPKVARRYKFDYLLRVLWRIDDFSQACGQCQAFHDDINIMMKELALQVNTTGRGNPGLINKQVEKISQPSKPI